MTYHSDPTRWSQLSSGDGEAPAMLRDAFNAGSREGPSDLQMRTLALKLAAVGTGAALAGGAATAQASTTATGTAGAAIGAVKTGGALTLSKIAVSLALVSAAATGAIYIQRDATPPATRDLTQVAYVEPARAVTAVPAAAVLAAAPVSAAQKPVVEKMGAPVTSPAAASKTDIAVASLDRPAVQAQPSAPESKHEVDGARSVDTTEVTPAKPHHVARAEHRAHESETAPVASAEPSKSAAASNAPQAKAERAAGQRQQLSEIELLRSARSALAARPREAYRLAEEHKALYPQGVFAQERDALAVEAMQRAGDLKLARQLAQAFVQHYPSSPHAHRFRETMNLQ